MIYTRQGDGGKTTLIGGAEVSKCDVQVEAYGTVDELMTHIAMVVEMAKPLDTLLAGELQAIESSLFTVQTILACPTTEVAATMPQLPGDATQRLEEAIDRMTAQLPMLTTFVLPGGTPESAQCHIARTVCRRAERRIVELSTTQHVAPEILTYVNRLSDYLFTLSRLLVHLPGGEEQYVKIHQKHK